MKSFAPLDYILDLGDRETCSIIESAAPGRACKVLVYPKDDPSAERILAIGTRSWNGEWFLIEVITPDGRRDSYPLKYQELRQTISVVS
jgi:hypothetical protein